MRPNWSGNQIATVLLPEHMVTKIAKKDRKTGLESAVYTVKLDFNCRKSSGASYAMFTAIRATGCKLKDRSMNCMICGGFSYLSKDCKEPPNCFLCN
jgi:hypothetical protein